jgi:sarcosine oxidase subunit alpha
MSGGWSPAVHLWSHCGGKLTGTRRGAFFRPDPASAADGARWHRIRRLRQGLGRGVHAAGDAGECVATGGAARRWRSSGKPERPPHGRGARRGPDRPVWLHAAGRGPEETRQDVARFPERREGVGRQLAAREGYESVEHTKRYTTLGMATDQGKLSNINGLAVLADALNATIPRSAPPPSARPSPRSPWARSRARRGARVPAAPPHADPWLARRGQWRGVGAGGPLAAALLLPETGREPSTPSTARSRQRQALRGLLDASTLGKILVKGPDAGASWTCSTPT